MSEEEKIFKKGQKKGRQKTTSVPGAGIEPALALGRTGF